MFLQSVVVIVVRFCAARPMTWHCHSQVNNYTVSANMIPHLETYLKFIHILSAASSTRSGQMWCSVILYRGCVRLAPAEVLPNNRILLAPQLWLLISLKSIMSEQILKRLSKCFKKSFTFAQISNIDIFETICTQTKFLVSRNIYCSRSARILCFLANYVACDRYDRSLLESSIRLSCTYMTLYTLTA